jgi:hypothetical protein
VASASGAQEGPDRGAKHRADRVSTDVFGHERRQPGERSLTELDVFDENGYGVVSSNTDEGIGREGACVGDRR